MIARTLARPLALGAACLLTAAFAVDADARDRKECERDYKPQVGQSGKDVVWVPTPDELVQRMLRMAKVTPQDLVYDLGAGDGKIAIAAGKLGANSVGIEYNPDMAKLANCLVTADGVASKTKIIQGDIFKEDFSKATVITMYLLPELNLCVRHRILAMKPGTRVTSHQFHMGDWEADEKLNIEFRDAYVWYVPADVSGEWAFKEEAGGFDGVVTLAQRYQRVGGTITTGGKTQPLLSPTLTGDKLAFSFVDNENNLRTVKTTVSGATMIGDLSWFGRSTNVSARRR